MGDLQRVAYVDDDPDIRAIVKLSLEHDDSIEVQTYDSGTAALDGMGKDVPQLLLLDVMMPGLNGIGLLGAMRRNDLLAHVPVLFATARLTDYEVDFYRSMGAIGVIHKPFNPMTLTSLVRAHWQRYLNDQSEAGVAVRGLSRHLSARVGATK